MHGQTSEASAFPISVAASCVVLATGGTIAGSAPSDEASVPGSDPPDESGFDSRTDEIARALALPPERRAA